MNRYLATIEVDPVEGKKNENDMFVIYIDQLITAKYGAVEFHVSAENLGDAFRKAYEKVSPTQGIKSLSVKLNSTWPPQ